MDSLMLSNEEASKDSRANFNSNHSNDATTIVAYSSDDSNNENDSNEQQRNSTLRSVDFSEEMEWKFEEGHDNDGEAGLFYDAMPALEKSLVEENEDMLNLWT